MNDRILAWLENLGPGRCAECLRTTPSLGMSYPRSRRASLEALGVLLGHRKILLRAIVQLSQSAEGIGSEKQPFPPERSKLNVPLR